MSNSVLKRAVVAACLVTLASAAQADEEMERMLDEAMPHMHHSCESVLETYSNDEEAVAGIVRLMVAVSLYNRQIDVIAMVPDEAKRAQLRDEFTEELEAACDDDPGRLLAGAVDDAVKNTMAAFDG
ncbi:hypothetical protein [Sulfitobacter sp. M23508]|uniref:hypothetical protein n=1 Tax=Sulfitobacter sp. M23508 TaxID=3368577 RepID=UPI003746CFE3